MANLADLELAHHATLLVTAVMHPPLGWPARRSDRPDDVDEFFGAVS
ncbi:MAG: hypothetical protein LCH80_03530 [Proteobacteria bacterium]|nr:hypothetical protein [Pseudomonadota bacterium]